MAQRKSAFVEDEIKIPPLPETKTIQEERHEAVSGLFQLAQFGCLCFGQLSDAGAIGLHADAITAEGIKWAETNPKILAKVDLLVKAGPAAGLISVAIPLVAQLLVNHKVFKPEMLANAGVVAPESLESLMKTQLMRQAADAMRVQIEAEEELEKLRMQMATAQNGHAPEEEKNGAE